MYKIYLIIINHIIAGKCKKATTRHCSDTNRNTQCSQQRRYKLYTMYKNDNILAIWTTKAGARLCKCQLSAIPLMHTQETPLKARARAAGSGRRFAIPVSVAELSEERVLSYFLRKFVSLLCLFQL